MPALLALGADSFRIAFVDETDLAAVAAGVSRFLAVESCGLCTPYKQDGLAIADLLTRIFSGEGNNYDRAGVADRVATVADVARCFLAHQHQRVVLSVLRLLPDVLQRHLDPGQPQHLDPGQPATRRDRLVRAAASRATPHEIVI